MIRRRRPTAPIARRRPPRVPVACDEVLSGTPAFGRLIGPLSETKLCEGCFSFLVEAEKKQGWDKESMLKKEES